MTEGPRVVAVGLGPAGADLMVPAARTALERARRRFVRTARHRAVEDLERAGIDLETFDDRYESAADLDEVYRGIADALVEAARTEGEVAYAVPGSPTAAERTVELLREAAASGTITLDVVPGLSFAELAWTRLGLDPMCMPVRMVDARDLRPDPASVPGPLLVAQCDDRLVLADVKVALLEVLDPATPVTVLRHLGLPDEEMREVALADLDRDLEPDHLTALFVDGGGRAAAFELARLLALAERLRRPGGCPWDAEQTHHSLTRYLLEEAYEVVEAVERLPVDAPAGSGGRSPAYGALEDELGDLLYQVIFHAVLAQEAGAFTMADVARGIHDKLVHRHPHVFGDAAADTSSDVMRNWEQIKKDEKGSASIVDDITPGLPSLLFAHKLLRKAASVGLDPGGRAEALTRIEQATADLRDADSLDTLEPALAELLSAAVVLARSAGVDAESVLRGRAAAFLDRFRRVETLAADRSIDLTAADPSAVEALWEEAAGS